MIIALFNLIMPFLLLFANEHPNASATDLDHMQLVDQRWDMAEIRFLQENNSYYYNRLIPDKNTINFSNDFVISKSDGTGIYHQSDDLTYPLPWQFNDADKTQINFTISKFRDGQDLSVTWEHITISNKTISYCEYYTHSTGVNSFGHATRTTSAGACDDSFQ